MGKPRPREGKTTCQGHSQGPWLKLPISSWMAHHPEQYVDWASLGYLRGGSLLPAIASPWPVLLFYPLSCWQIPSVSSQAAPRVVRHINDGRPWPLFLPISSQSPFPRAHTGLGLPSYLVPSPGGIMAHSESVQP